MKKALSICVLLALIFILPACSGGKPDDVSDSAYNAGKKAIEVTDEYLNYEISSEEAAKLIKDINSRKPCNTDEYTGDLIISIDLSSLETSIQHFYGQTDEDVLNARNSIARTINEPER